MENQQERCPGCFTPFKNQTGCPVCYDLSESQIPIALPLGCILNDRYIIGRVLGKPGGFGITYLAWDEVLNTRMAIKEYFPRDLSGRAKDNFSVLPHSKEDAEVFAYGLQQYIVEARTLNQFEHPNIVKVHNYFNANGTAYMVMEYYQGTNLDELLAKENGLISEDRAIRIILPIMDGLRQVHSKGFLHRDIKPGNIYLRDDGRPVLLDFGAARLAVKEKSQSLSIIITPGYTPFEQYHRRGKQGPWTDIYSLGAVLYHLTTGITPPHSPERIENDELIAPHLVHPQISEVFSQEIMKALSMDAACRQQTVEELSDHLFKILRKSTPVHLSEVSPVLANGRKADKSLEKPAFLGNSKVKWALAVFVLLLVAGLSLAYYKGWPPFTGLASTLANQDSSVLTADINANHNKAPDISDSSTISSSSSQVEQKPPENSPPDNGGNETPRAKARVTVPNVVGLPLVNARRAIEGNNLTLGEVRRENSEQYPLNTVIRQSIAAGTLVDKGTQVNITISAGPPRVRRQN